MVQRAPSQCIATLTSSNPLSPAQPTAQASFAPSVATSSSLTPCWRFGLGTTFHEEPSKCIVSERFWAWPTAQMSLGERPELPFNWVAPVPSVTVAVRRHVPPWRRPAMLPDAPAQPTAHTALPEAATPSSRLSVGSGDGDCATVQALASQCMVSVRQLPATSYTPTAHASFAESETTLF